MYRPKFMDPNKGVIALTAKLLASIFSDIPDTGTFTDLTASGSTQLAATSVSSLVNSGLESNTGVETGITAGTTQTQAGATVMSATQYAHTVGTVGTTGDGVRLGVAATVGAKQFVANDGANNMQLYGLGTDTINGVTTTTGVTVNAGQGAWMYCSKAGNWHALVG